MTHQDLPVTRAFSSFEVGEHAHLTRTVREQDVQKFAEISGDFNPVHFDEELASQTIFGGRIAHGILTASFISRILGENLPGPGSIYMTQSLRFVAPVRIGDEVETTARIVEVIPEKRRLRLETACSVKGKPVLTGEALMWMPPRQV
ncbi:MAG: MaoC family dehydratase [Alphaproteobacteria bacterium]